MKETKVILNNRNFIADIKRKAAETYPKQEKINKNNAEIARLQEMNADLQAEIDGANISVRKKTVTATKPEGYTALELCHRVVDSTGKFDKNGFEIKKTSYILNWPDTVIPPVEEKSCEDTCSITAAAVDNVNDPVGTSVEEEAALQDAVEAQADNYEAAERMYAEARAEEAE